MPMTAAKVTKVCRLWCFDGNSLLRDDHPKADWIPGPPPISEPFFPSACPFPGPPPSPGLIQSGPSPESTPDQILPVIQERKILAESAMLITVYILYRQKNGLPSAVHASFRGKLGVNLHCMLCPLLPGLDALGSSGWDCSSHE